MSEELVSNEYIEEQDKVVNLPLGEPLFVEDTYPITSKYKTKLIAFVGPSECGKTTLITTFYQLFHKGPVNEFYFAGSQTLKGFEQRAYYTRTNSGRSNPDTQRTRVGSLDSFLHLKLWSSIDHRTHTFLLTDFSGEDFKNARANVDVMKEDFSIIKEADSLVIIIDGNSITQKDKRFSAIQTTQELLRTMKNADVLRKTTKICFVISKYDIVNIKCKEDSSLNSFIEGIPKKLIGILDDIDIKNEVKFYDIAAMPKENQTVSVGYGISELFEEWIENPIVDDSNIFFGQKELKSEFNRFYKKVLGGVKDE